MINLFSDNQPCLPEFPRLMIHLACFQLSVDSHVRMEGSASAQMLVPVQMAGWVASVSVSLSLYLTNCVLRFYFEFRWFAWKLPT